MICCKLCHIIHYMLPEGSIIRKQLPFLVKLQPVFDGIPIECYRFVSKCICDICFCQAIIHIYHILKF